MGNSSLCFGCFKIHRIFEAVRCCLTIEAHIGGFFYAVVVQRVVCPIVIGSIVLEFGIITISTVGVVAIYRPETAEVTRLVHRETISFHSLPVGCNRVVGLDDFFQRIEALVGCVERPSRQFHAESVFLSLIFHLISIVIRLNLFVINVQRGFGYDTFHVYLYYFTLISFIVKLIILHNVIFD